MIRWFCDETKYAFKDRIHNETSKWVKHNNITYGPKEQVISSANKKHVI